ncbi:hypothetical protein N789_03405 [Arenimonas oryziterrae DSM 21050 = YC6267]|uniref:Acyltransferase 3 domain-containing protein n=1 Tax=Arenimonas oryziterrae DSM 21050 = YC6267 TaxID=1121015 RepID=A0A091B0J0_9GAMM|nr:hypothetical protein N789_03405 [Arenimonas oryziterrae DSM 21050 = YC6267]
MLDAVRSLAIVLVIGHHASFRFAAAAGDVVAGFFKSVGWIGVDLFFALSGFLIVKILIRDSERGDIIGFFKRRFFRIVPVFAISVAVYGLASLVTGHDVEHLGNLWITALFLNGWAIPFLGVDEVPFTIAWSLSVEEFAYLALGVSAAFPRGMLRKVVTIFLVMAIAVRLLVLAGNVFPTDLLYFFVPARLDAIAFGGLGAFGAYDFLLKRKNCSAIAGISTIGLMIGFQWLRTSGWVLPLFGYAVFGLVCAIWVSSLAFSPKSRPGLLIRSVAPLGKLSYFIYLFHMFFLDGLRSLQAILPGGNLGFWSGLIIATSGCYLAAMVSWRFIEGPLIRFGHRRASRDAAN